MKILLLASFFHVLGFAQGNAKTDSMGPCEASVSALKEYKDMDPDIQQMALALAYLKDQGVIQNIKSAKQLGVTRGGDDHCLALDPIKDLTGIGFGIIDVVDAKGKTMQLKWDANHVEDMTKEKWLNGSKEKVSNGHIGFNSQIKSGGFKSKCKYMESAGRSPAEIEGRAAIQGILLKNAPDSCKKTSNGKTRQWPVFCAAMISCEGKLPELMVCPSTDSSGQHYGCVTADACANAHQQDQKNPKVFFIHSKLVSEVGNKSEQSYKGYSWMGQPRAVTLTAPQSGSVPEGICVGQYMDPYGSIGLGTGLVSLDGSCKISGLVDDPCTSPHIDQTITRINRDYIGHTISPQSSQETVKGK